jgi:thiol:disulfide interchange protein DsbD
MTRIALLLAASSLAFAQINALSVGEIAPVRVKAGQSVEVKTPLQLKPGYHVQSNTPTDKYLIPLKLTWNAGPLSAGEAVYPKPKLEKYSFDDKPLSVFTDDFVVTTRFTAGSNAPPGVATLTGKVRYQACTDRECLPPRNVEVSVKVTVVK